MEEVGQTIERKRAGLRVLSRAVQMALSYTGSFSLVAIGVMIGHLGKNQVEDTNNLAATNLITALIQVLVYLPTAATFATGIHVANLQGRLLTDQSAKGEIETIAKNSIYLSLMMSSLAILPMLFSKDLLVAFNQNAEIAQLAQDYMRYYAIAMPALGIRTSLEQVMFGFEKQSAAMWISLGTFAIGTVLAYLLAFGPLGITGVAVGYVIEAYLTCFGFGLFLAKSKTLKDFNFFSKQQMYTGEDAKQIGILFKMGYPITLLVMCEVAALFLINMFAGWLGKVQLAAQNFASQFSFFSFIFIVAFGQATSQEVAAARGSGNFQNASRYAIYGLLAAQLFIALFCIAISAYPSWFTEIISNKSEVLSSVKDTAKYLLPIQAAGIFFNMMSYVMNQTLRVVPVTHTSLLATIRNSPTSLVILSLWVGVAQAYIFGFTLSGGIYGIAGGYSVGLTLSALAICRQWYRGMSNSETVDPTLMGDVLEGRTGYPCCARLLASFSSVFAKEREIGGHTPKSFSRESTSTLFVSGDKSDVSSSTLGGQVRYQVAAEAPRPL